MRNILFTVIGLFFFGNLCAQTGSYDSVRLQYALLKFKRHLDRAGVTSEQLLSMLETKSKHEPMGFIDGTNQASRYWKVPKTYFDKSKPIYSTSEIIPNDTNRVPFIETEYDFKVRPTLRYLKDEYLKEKRPEYRANILIDYVYLLNIHYPKLPNWGFSRSNTLWKYIDIFQSTILPLKRDTTKAYLYVTFADQLISMDQVYWREYAFAYYLFAEKILLKPFTDKLRGKTVSPQEGYNMYKEFILTDPHAVALSNVYIQIYKALIPLSWFDKNNTLAPLDNKRSYYITQALSIMRLLDSCHKIEKRYVWEYEKVYYTQLTNRYLKNFNRYTPAIYDNYIATLDYNISKLLVPGQIDSEYVYKKILYKTLGDIFYNINEPLYAYKAYCKALENHLKSDYDIINSWEVEDMFCAALRSIKMLIKREVQFPEKEIFIQVYEQFLKSAIELSDSTTVEYKSGLARKLVNKSLILILKDKSTEAQELLFNAREQAFFDTTDNSQSLTFFYDEINNNGWLKPISVCKSQIDRLDSIAYADDHTEKESHFDHIPYIEQIFSKWNQVESDAFWMTSSADLNDSIAFKQKLVNEKTVLISKKQNEISKLTTANTNLKKSNSVLADSIKQKNKYLRGLSSEIDSKSKQVENLAQKIKGDSAQLKQSEVANTTLKKDNDSLKESSNVLTTLVYILSPIALVLLTASLLFGRNIRQKRKQIQEHDTRIMDLKKEAEEKDLGKKLAQQQLLNDTALGHDLVELVGHIPLFIKQLGKSLPVELQSGNEYKKCLSFALRTEDYFLSNFKQKESLNTTVKADVTLAKQYVELLQLVDDDFPTTFHIDEFDQDIREIEIPKHNLVNFISNAYKHSRKNTKNTSVSIGAKAEKKASGYTIVITDTGGGFDTLGLENKPDTRGLKLVLRQIENFNGIEANTHSINFNEQNIENIYEGNARSGTRIRYTISKK